MKKKNLSKIIKLLKDGSIISIISDAGTPGISDPGAILVRECIKNKIEIIPLPGASALTAAISVSGFSDKFFFYGFFPEKLKTLKEDLKRLSTLNSSLVFFVSPKKLNKIIPFLRTYFEGRKILICREISKIYEEFTRSSVSELTKFEQSLKGELTIVISEIIDEKKTSQELSESDKSIIKDMINKLSIKEITNLIYSKSKISKKKIYTYCLQLKNEN